MSKKTNKYLAANVILPEDSQSGALLLGDCNSAVDLAILKPHKVRTIISIGLEAKPAKGKIPEDVAHHVYDIHDNKQQKLPVELLDQVGEIIEGGRNRGGVLVHCYAGVSRSSSFVIAYLIKKYIVSYDEAKERAKKRRPCVHPGDGFVSQLQNYSKIIAVREQQRLASLNKSEIPPQLPVQTTEKYSNSLTARTKRGVRGAVRSAEFISEELKSSILSKDYSSFQRNIEEKSQEAREGQTTSTGEKIEEKAEKNPDRLPPIHERYKACHSQAQIRQSIEKIEGRQSMRKGPSVQKIYGNRSKVM